MAFYVVRGGRFEATEHTRGPWDSEAQHVGPSCALIGRELDRAGGIDPGRLTRLTLDVLGPVPLGPVEVNVQVARPGRRIELLEAELSEPGGTALIRARGWRMRTEPLELDEQPPPEPEVPGPGEASEREYFPSGQDTGFHTGMEIRFVRGGWLEPGPALAWLRMRVPLVEGEEPTQLERVLICADTGNGASSPLDYRRWVFVNTDVTLQLRRQPGGDWVGLDAVTYAETDGTGISDTRVLDERGVIGRATQSILVLRRD